MDIKQLIKIQCIKSGNIPLNEVARRCGWWSGNITKRLNNNNWAIEDLQKIATNALDCALFVAFKYKDQITTADSISDMIKIQCILSGDIPQKELASRLDIAPAMLSHRMRRDRWRVPQLEEIASALDCELILEFRPISK